MISHHDLPPRWDGYAVEWTAWEDEMPSTLQFHLTDFGACEQCGSLAPRQLSRGSLYIKDAKVTKFQRRGPSWLPRTEEQDLLYLRNVLLACRCQDCHHDIVVNMHTRESWDLGPEDYTDAGSYDAKKIDPALVPSQESAGQPALF